MTFYHLVDERPNHDVAAKHADGHWHWYKADTLTYVRQVYTYFDCEMDRYLREGSLRPTIPRIDEGL